MTGEKDAPAEMPVVSHETGSRETQSALRITAATQAPAEMPSEEDVARVIQRHIHPVKCGTVFAARAVLALFAPILAEKERDNRQLRLEVAEERETSRISIYGWRDKANEMEARALAAEAALAAARAEYQSLRAVYDASLEVWGQHAAAIRAQGE